MLVYKKTNKINGKVYIGQSIYSIEDRWKEHVSDAKRGSTRVLCKAIRKYGEKAFLKETIDIANSPEELNKKEEEWIIKLGSHYLDGFGYNMNYGGGSNSGYKAEPSMVKRRAEKQKKPILCVNTGKIYPSAKEAAEEFGISLSFLHNVVNGRKSTAKGLKFESLDLKVKEKATERKKQRKEITDKNFTFGRPVVCVSTGEEFSSVKEVTKKLGVAENNMTFHLQGKQKTMKGHVFRYKDELVKEGEL